jgi:hypothetical protein
MEQIAEQGFDHLPELIRIVINAAMQAERQKHLGLIRMSAVQNGGIMPTGTSPKR